MYCYMWFFYSKQYAPWEKTNRLITLTDTRTQCKVKIVGQHLHLIFRMNSHITLYRNKYFIARSSNKTSLLLRNPVKKIHRHRSHIFFRICWEMAPRIFNNKKYDSSPSNCDHQIIEIPIIDRFFDKDEIVSTSIAGHYISDVCKSC